MQESLQCSRACAYVLWHSWEVCMIGTSLHACEVWTVTYLKDSHSVGKCLRSSAYVNLSGLTQSSFPTPSRHVFVQVSVLHILTALVSNTILAHSTAALMPMHICERYVPSLKRNLGAISFHHPKCNNCTAKCLTHFLTPNI